MNSQDHTMGVNEPSNRVVLATIYQLIAYRPILILFILFSGLITSALEGIGIGFILPIVELSQDSGGGSDASGLLLFFEMVYEFLGVPFRIEYLIGGVILVIGTRYLFSFLMEWFASILRVDYIQYLRTESFRYVLDANVSYFDDIDSDELINTIITQTEYAGDSIYRMVRGLQILLISIAYVVVALFVAPYLTLISGIILGFILYSIRYKLESGFSVGNRVAEANQQVQEAIQAGIEGFYEVKLFNMADEVFADLGRAVGRYKSSLITQRRNQSVISNFNQFATAVSIFLLLYVGIEIASLRLSSLGVFLFALFRLGPKISQLNTIVYRTENSLPHLVRTQRFVTELEQHQETTGTNSPPETIYTLEFDNVNFSYKPNSNSVIERISFEVHKGEFIAFVGRSGAGKSTIISLLTRMYDPNTGRIKANGTSITQFDVNEWRSHFAVVRQSPYIFSDTLKYNITLGNRGASTDQIKRVCEIAKVTEFLDSLPNGYDSELGDNGLRLSGGQRQRVAIARALLKDADFLILDEATSELDSHLEEEIHQGLKENCDELGVITIAHRISSITDADRIYVMDNGKITERGSHQILLERCNEYKQLYEIQSS